MPTGLLEFLFSSAEDVDFLVLLYCVEFGAFGLLLENDFFAYVLLDIYMHTLEIFVL